MDRKVLARVFGVVLVFAGLVLLSMALTELGHALAFRPLYGPRQPPRLAMVIVAVLLGLASFGTIRWGVRLVLNRERTSDRQRGTILGGVLTHHCPDCGNRRSWLLLCQNPRTLGFIPIVPFQKQYLLVCGGCGIGPRLTGEQLIAAQSLARGEPDTGGARDGLEQELAKWLAAKPA